jgi:ABC-type sugar transport system permease subunit
MYRAAFTINRVGYGSAIAIILTLIILIITIIILRGQRTQDEESFA